MKIKYKYDKYGFVKSATNPKGKGTVYIAQTLSNKSSQNFVVRGKGNRPLGYSKTEKGAFNLAFKKKKGKVIYLD